mmetsp:Transcript_9393/g.18297  ORF Transcript_9393/g.18297 Transcript_9393/m.18297 type:complete len:87 (+) Transcript_9393:273-533(+)
MVIYSALLHAARKVIKTMPLKDIKIRNNNPLVLAVAKSVHKAPWTASTYKAFTLWQDSALYAWSMALSRFANCLLTTVRLSKKSFT